MASITGLKKGGVTYPIFMEMMTVHITEETVEGVVTYSADKTFSEISAHLGNGRMAAAVFTDEDESTYYTAHVLGGSGVGFSNILVDSDGVTQTILTIDAEDAVTFETVTYPGQTVI